MSSEFFASLEPGARVVLRYRLAPTDHGPAGERLSDALGYLLEADAENVVLQTRSGNICISRAAITHAKRVPPPPARRRSRTGD